MVDIKKQRVAAYILLEGLIAFAMLVSIIAIILAEISQQRQLAQAEMVRQEVLNVAQMAIQTGEQELHLNGVAVRLERTENEVIVFNREKEILRISEK